LPESKNIDYTYFQYQITTLLPDGV